MKLNISNPIEAIFNIGQNVKLQIMATCFKLSKYLLFVINLPRFKLFNAESAVFRMTSVKYTDLKSPDKEIHFSL